MKPIPTLALATMLLAGIANGALPQPLDALLEPVRARNALPALAAVVVHRGEIVALGATGLRRSDGTNQVTTADKWHVGSCTKSMTATLSAMLVEEGVLRWDTTLADMFPKLAPRFQPGWRDVTLDQLLAHRGGAPGDLNADGLWGRIWQRAAQPPLEQRAYAVGELLAKHKPIAAPGEKFQYSNAGYMLVGHAIETKLGKAWEDVLRKRLFAPLKMDSSGFGMPASPGKADQPWGHASRLLPGPKPVPPGLQADNPAAIGPGGTVHCSLDDLAKYAMFHLRGDRDGHALLKRESFTRLHTRFGADGDYARGWAVLKRGWGGGDVLMHNGSNTMNFTVMWLAPLKDFAVIVCTNIGGDGAAKAADDAAGQLIQKFLTDGGARR